MIFINRWKWSGFFPIQLLIVLLSGRAALSDDYSAWSYSKKITLNTTGSGANVTENKFNFPLLIRLNPGTFSHFSQTKSGGADIRFSKTDGTTPLPYQIERWVDNGDNDTAEIWVRIDTVYGSNSTQGLIMYWGNAYAADSSDSAVVFSSTNGFMATYHLAGNLNDATGHGYNGTNSGGSMDTASGIIGRARAFNGSTQYFQAGILPDRPSGAISFWFRPNAPFNSSSSTTWGIWGKTESGSMNANLSLRGSDFQLGDGSVGAIQTKIENSDASAYISSVTNSFNAGTWYHVAWVWGSNADSLFLNGVADSGNSSYKTIAGNVNDEIGRAYYDEGNISGGGPRYFNGTLDEFRIDYYQRTASWVKLNYENQKPGQKLVVYPASYTWDNSTASGIQTGGGTWGTDNYWSLTGDDGRVLFPWPGAGSSARFAGSDVNKTITVSGTQYVDSLTFSNSGYTLSSGTINFGTKSGIYIASTKSATISAVIAGTGGLSKAGTGTLILTAANSYSGGTTVGAGTLQLGNGGAAGSITGDVVNSGTLIVNRMGTLSYSGAISGTGALTKSGTGTLILTGNNTFSGATTIGAGTLQVGNGAATGAVTGDIANNEALIINRSGTLTYGGVISGSGTVASNGPGTLVLTGNNTDTGAITVSSVSTLQIGNGGASGAVAGNITNNGVLIVNRSGTLTYGRAISGTGTLTKSGTGTLLLTGSNTYSGATTVSTGTLQIGDGASGSVASDILNNSALVVNRTGTLTYSGVISGTGTLAKSGTGTLILTGSNTLTGATTVSAGALQIGSGGNGGSFAGDITDNAAVIINRTGTLTYGGAISGSGTLTKSGNGTLILTGANTFSGVTTVSGGTVQIGSGGTSGSISGDIADNGSLIFNRSDAFTYGGGIGGTGSVTIAGTGTLTLSGAHTYTGATTISGGTLLVDGSTAAGSAITVASGATLGGTGACGGTVTVNGGTIAPGASGPGKLTAGALRLDSVSIISFDLGTQSDTIAVAGNLTLDGTVNFASGTGFATGTYRLITFTGTLTDSTLNVGSGPAGIDFTLQTGSNYIDVVASMGLIQTEPRDTMVIAGNGASFSVTADGTGTLHYKWLRYHLAGQPDSVGNSTSLSIDTVSAGDNGLIFRCVVRDDNGSDTSRAAVLTVIDTPRIATQPHDTTVPYGENAVFSLLVTDTSSVTYAWKKTDSSTVLGTGASLTVTSTTFADSGSSFFCEVTNMVASVNSDTVVLRVDHIPPAITKQPVSDTILIGENALFTVTATGNAAPAYSWRKVGGADPVGAGASLSITSASFADSGLYYCIISNPGGAVTSDTVRLLIGHFAPYGANVLPDTLTVLVGSVARFSITAGGTEPFTYNWYKVRGTADSLLSVNDDTLLFGATAFADSGDYYCIVGNPGGTFTSDTVHLAVGHTKPIAAFSFTPKNGQAPLSVAFTDASTGAVTSRLWRFGDNGTDTAASPTHTYTDTGLYTVMLIVTGPGGTDSLVKHDSLFAYAEGANPVRMSARFLTGADVEVTLTGINDIDTFPPSPECDSMGVWYKPHALPAGSADGTLIVRYRRSAFKGTGMVDTLTLPAADSLYGLMSGLYWHDGSISGFSAANGCMVLLRDTTVPQNPLSLTATAATASSIRLSWNKITDASISKVRIWYGKSIIDTGLFTPHSGFDSLVITPADTAAVITGLSSDTTYYFGIQVAKGTHWSIITDKSRTSCRTPATGIDTVNTIVIDTLYFDSLTGSIRISWCIDTASVKKGVEIGISYGLTQFPTSADGCYTVYAFSRCTDTLVRLNETVRFDTLYYVALWFRTPNGTWLAPTIDSRKTVHIGRPFRQSVTFFDPGAEKDTVFGFNDAILLWKDSTYTDKVTVNDTLEVVRFDTLPQGMIVVGTPFLFKKGDPVLPFHVGIRIDSLPGGASLKEVRIYSDSAGSYSVHYETVVDSVHGIVSIKTADLRRSFIAMIDTMPPKVTIFSDTASVVYSTANLKDSLRIDDNIANVQWKYYYSRGDDVPQQRVYGETRSTSTGFSLIISEKIQMISSESGLRSFLVISDGAHLDTINLSRSVFRYESDKLTTEEGVWTPVYPTAVLNNKDAYQIVAQLSPQQDMAEYDRRYMRFYRWVAYEGNSNEPEKWIEYNQDKSDIRSLFTLEPGRMVWLKTRGNMPFHLDSGYTLSLKNTFTVDLPPQQWTDFGMPYRFGVRMEEILSSSGSDGESVQVYQWERDSSSHIYYLEPLYVPGMSGEDDRSRIVEYLPRGGYSFYNNSSKRITLRIPPILPAMGKKLSKTTEKNSPSWSTKFVAESDNGTEFPAVYFGYAPGIKKSAYPLPPSFSALRLSVFDRRTAVRYGHHIGDDAKGGLVKELMISNDADTARTIRYHLEHAGAFPENYSACCFDAAVKKLDAGGTATIAPKSIASRWIITGDAAYRENFLSTMLSLRFALHALYPNPARSSVNIRYTVPFGARERIRIGIYNVLGKRVWEKRIDGLLAEGSHIVTWNGRDIHGSSAGSGLYIVRLTVVDSRGRITKRFDRRVTWMR
ncbi:MAG: DUF2341 domain-containing protein [Chitinispirillaceae bacterium]|nr:DUF2341 domain-containing protein [Chitinispirillaceae bacterium]